jgi:hypothetical protein
VAFNEASNNTAEGTLVVFEPGVEASLAFRSRSRSRSRNPRQKQEQESLPGTKNQSFLCALTPTAKVSPPQPVPRKNVTTMKVILLQSQCQRLSFLLMVALLYLRFIL